MIINNNNNNDKKYIYIYEVVSVRNLVSNGVVKGRFAIYLFQAISL